MERFKKYALAGVLTGGLLSGYYASKSADIDTYFGLEPREYSEFDNIVNISGGAIIGMAIGLLLESLRQEEGIPERNE